AALPVGPRRGQAGQLVLVDACDPGARLRWHIFILAGRTPPGNTVPTKKGPRRGADRPVSVSSALTRGPRGRGPVRSHGRARVRRHPGAVPAAGRPAGAGAYPRSTPMNTLTGRGTPTRPARLAVVPAALAAVALLVTAGGPQARAGGKPVKTRTFVG